jgi:hypothetical protein
MVREEVDGFCLVLTAAADVAVWRDSLRDMEREGEKDGQRGGMFSIFLSAYITPFF